MNERDTDILKEALIEWKKREQDKIDELSEPYMPNPGNETTSMPSSIVYSENNCRISHHMPIKLIAAIIAATLCVSMLVSCAFVPKIREFIVKVYEGFIDLVVNAPVQEPVDELYMPSYIPDGYSLATYGYGTVNKVEWSDGERTIEFKQTGLGGIITMDTENAEYEALTVGDHTVYKTEKNGQASFIWEDDKYSYVLHTPDTLSIDEISLIILSVELREMPPDF